MQKLQSVSGHSSKQSIPHYSSLPTVSQLKGVSDTISNLFKNHQPQRTQISSVTNAPFIQNSNRMASRLTATASFPSKFFLLLWYSRQRPSFNLCPKIKKLLNQTWQSSRQPKNPRFVLNRTFHLQVRSFFFEVKVIPQYCIVQPRRIISHVISARI